MALRRGAAEPKAKPSYLAAILSLFFKGGIVTPGDPAGRYLLGRGCAVPDPESHVRWAPAHRHPSGHVGPALLALVTDALTQAPMTLHQTWLAADGSGKARLERPRLLWKGLPKKGGIVRLVPDEEVTTGLAVAEGIETALTAVRAGYPCWATIDAGNLASFPVLPGVEALTIVADRDEVNRSIGRAPGLAAARACADRWAGAGREVRIWAAAEIGHDFNDLASAAA